MPSVASALKDRLAALPFGERLSGLMSGASFARGGVPVGVEIGSRNLRIAVLDGTHPGARVSHLLEAPLPKGVVGPDASILDPEGLTEEIGRLLESAKVARGDATVMVGGTDVLVRRVAISRAPRDEALRTLPTAPNLKLPSLDLESTKLDLAILDPAATHAQMQVLVVAARKEAIRLRQKVVLDAGLGLHAVDVDSCALFNIVEHCDPECLKRRVTLLNIAADATQLVVVDQGAPAVVRQADLGVVRLVDALAASGMVLAEDAARAIESGANPAAIHQDGYNGWLDSLVEEARRSVASLRSGAAGTGDLLVTGVGAGIDGLVAALRERAGVPTRLFDPLATLGRAESLAAQPPQVGARFALALGLAVRQLV